MKLLSSTLLAGLVCLTLAGTEPKSAGKSPFMELAGRRFSVRKYSEKKVDRELLLKILEAGNIAPTAMNFQPHRIHVL